MKKLLVWLLTAALLCSLCVTGVLAAEAEEDVIWGSYVLIDMNDGTGQDYASMLSAMAQMGMSGTMEVAEDGSAKMELFGETMELRLDFASMTADAGDVTLSFTYEDGVLFIGDDEMSFTFSKNGGEAAQKKGAGAFDYYLLTAFEEPDGTVTSADGFEIPLRIFAAGDGVITNTDGEEMELQFDFDEGTVLAEDGEEMTFEREDGVLTLIDSEGVKLTFALSDPGWAGPYAIVALSTEDQGDLGEQLDMLNALGLAPTLTIDEDGKGVLDMFGESVEMTFDFDAMTVTGSEEGDEAMPFTYENGRLTMQEGENILVFGRTLPAEEDAPAEGHAKGTVR